MMKYKSLEIVCQTLHQVVLEEGIPIVEKKILLFIKSTNLHFSF